MAAAMSSDQGAGEHSKKKRNYKLLVDPELKKGAIKKIYRFDGVIPGQPPILPPKDPREQKIVLGGSRKVWELLKPRFKYDRFSVTAPPQWEIFVSELSHSVTATILKALCSQVGPVVFVKLHRLGSDEEHLGVASVGFRKKGDGQNAVERLNGVELMSSTITAVLDDMGEKAKQYLREAFEGKNAKHTFKPSSLTLPPFGMSDATLDTSPDLDPHPRGEIKAPCSSLSSPHTPSSGGVTPYLKLHSPFLFPSSGPFSPAITSPSVKTPSSLDSGIGVGMEMKLEGASKVAGTQPPLMSVLLVRQATPSSATRSNNTANPSPRGSVSQLIGDNKRAQPNSLHKRSSCPQTKPGLLSEQYETISNSEDEAEPKSGMGTMEVTSKSSSLAAVLSPVSDISSEEKSSAEEAKAESLNFTSQNESSSRFANTFKPVISTSSGYSLATFPTHFDPLQALMTLKSVESQPTDVKVYQSSLVEDISGDESPELVVMDEITPTQDGNVSGDDDMDLSDDESGANDNTIELGSANEKAHLAPPISIMYPSPSPYPPPPTLMPPLPYPPGIPPPPPPGPMGFCPPMGFPPHGPPPGPRPSSFPSPAMPSMPYPPRWPTFPVPERKPQRRAERKLTLSSLKRDVCQKIMRQLKEVLMKDLHRKYIEKVGSDATDKNWERRHQGRREEMARNKQPTDQHYRPMLSQTQLTTSSPSTTPQATIRQRLVSFKIPTVSRSSRGNAVVVTMRRPSAKRLRSPLYSDFSSSDFTSESDTETQETDTTLVPMETEVKKIPSQEDVVPEEMQPSSSEEDEESLSDFVQVFGRLTSSSDSEIDVKGYDGENLTIDSPEKVLDVADVFSSDSDLEAKHQNGLLTNLVKSPVLSPKFSPPPKSKKRIQEYSNRYNQEFEKRAKDPVLSPPPTPTFTKRLSSEDDIILSSFLEEGLDAEDVEMMRKAYLELKTEQSPLVEDTHWAHYPGAVPDGPVVTPLKRRRTASQVTLGATHKTGCARSEGYYKIDARTKKGYVTSMGVQHQQASKEKSKVSQQDRESSGRVNRAKHRRLAVVIASSEVTSDILKYSVLKSRGKTVRFARSSIHGWGLYALENVPADEMVIEYVGEVIRSLIADEREHRYEGMGIGSSYLFRLDGESVIDATKRGNQARFINHCCDPNCYAKVITIGTQKKIVIYSKRDIRANEEITYDYKFPIEDEKIPCLCGAPNCRGTLN